MPQLHRWHVEGLLRPGWRVGSVEIKIQFNIYPTGRPKLCVFFLEMGVPPNGWFIMENTIKMDDLGVPLFQETPISNITVGSRIAEKWDWGLWSLAYHLSKSMYRMPTATQGPLNTQGTNDSILHPYSVHCTLDLFAAWLGDVRIPIHHFLRYCICWT